jgi:hypothetical protein
MRTGFRKPLLSAILVLALAVSATPSSALAQPISGISTTIYNEGTDLAAPFYNPVVVSNINLTLPQQSVNTLNNDPSTKVYQTANIRITTADGVITTLNNIGVRLKGQASRTNLFGKAPLKLKFDAFVKGQKFMGLTRMTLNSMIQDPSFIREDTAYRIYRAMGLVAPRTTYSWVTLNNADFGLYMNVGSIDAQMLKRWLNPVHVYSSDCYLADLTFSQSSCFDTSYGSTDKTRFNAAVAVSALNGETWWNEVNKVAHMDQVINLMATDLYTSNWDGYTDVVQNNYYIVFDDTGKLRIIPWGQDQAFPMQEDAQLDFLGRGPAFRNFGNQERSVMLRKCVAYTPCQSQLVKAQVAVKDKVASLTIPAFKNKVASVINNAYIAKETRSNPDVSSAAYWQNWLEQFCPMRTSALTAFLNTRNPEAPALSMNGPSTIGSTLVAEASTWDYASTLSYQWLRNGQQIANATGTSYLTTIADANTLISVRVRATKPGRTTATSNSMAVLVNNSPLPSASIAGEPRVGVPIVGGPLADSTATVTYRWFLNGSAISGATGSTYTPLPEDHNKSISLLTTVTQAGYPVAISSSQTKIIQAGVIPKPTVTVLGNSRTGENLTAQVAITSPNAASYQWLRNGKAITGGNKSSYTLTSTDYKASVSVRVTLSQVGFDNATTTSSGVRVGLGELVRTPEPIISGTPRVNSTIKARIGSWDTGVKLSYQWLRDGVNIPRATGTSYRLTTADRRAELTLRVRATKTGFESVTIDSRTVIGR